MNKNSFSFMKEGFDWQSEQSKDMIEIRNDAIYEEELRRESAELRDYNDFFDMEDR